MHPDALPMESIRRAWARALRHVNEPVAGHDDPRVVLLGDGIVAQLAIDEKEEGRYARVSVARGAAGAPTLEHDDAVPLVARIYLEGRFEPFPVECVIGADGVTLHYVIDLESYKDAKAQDHVARAQATVGAANAADAELAAIQLAAPLQLLARTWDAEKAERRDPRMITFLSDRFLVPRRWIEFQIEHYLAELAEGAIDAHGTPTDKPGRDA